MFSRLLVVGAALIAFSLPCLAASADPDEILMNTLLGLSGGMLVDARAGEWRDVRSDLEALDALLGQQDMATSEMPVKLPTILHDTQKVVAKAESDPDGAYGAVSTLARALNDFLTQREMAGGDAQGFAAAGKILPHLQATRQAVQRGDNVMALQTFGNFNTAWLSAEPAIRADNFKVYGDVEIHLTGIRASLQATPPKMPQAAKLLEEIIGELQEYQRGGIASVPARTEARSIGDLLTLLDTTLQHVTANDAAAASSTMTQFTSDWLQAEGQVQLRSASTYTVIENQMGEMSAYLISNPPRFDRAESLIRTMQSELEPLANATTYSAWDAAIILLREGLEALLVVAALLAFLDRSGNAEKSKWVWAGAASGLVLSAVLAVVLVYALSVSVAGSARELIEGITGLMAVALMLTVGVWLHDKANLRSWNKYIEQQVGSALAQGSLWSLFAIALLAVLREGAETTVFFLGLASAIGLGQLLLGAGSALLVLIVLGYALIHLSIRLPVRQFFLGAAIVIYYLVLRFTGESVHALQIAGYVPVHFNGNLPTVGWLGLYPTRETVLSQAGVLVLVLAQVAWTSSKNNAKPQRKQNFTADSTTVK